MHIPNYFTYYQYLLVFPFCICATYYPCICSDVLCFLVFSHLITLGYPERLPCRPCVMLFLPLLTFALHPCKLHIAFSGLWRGDCCCKEFNPSLFNSLTNQGILRFKSSKLISGYRVILFFCCVWIQRIIFCIWHISFPTFVRRLPSSNMAGHLTKKRSLALSLVLFWEF